MGDQNCCIIATHDQRSGGPLIVGSLLESFTSGESSNYSCVRVVPTPIYIRVPSPLAPLRFMYALGFFSAQTAHLC